MRKSKTILLLLCVVVSVHEKECTLLIQVRTERREEVGMEGMGGDRQEGLKGFQKRQ